MFAIIKNMTYCGFNLRHLTEIIFEFTALKRELQMQTTKSKRNILSMTWRGDFGCRRFFVLLGEGKWLRLLLSNRQSSISYDQSCQFISTALKLLI